MYSPVSCCCTYLSLACHNDTVYQQRGGGGGGGIIIHYVLHTIILWYSAEGIFLSDQNSAYVQSFVG